MSQIAVDNNNVSCACICHNRLIALEIRLHECDCKCERWYKKDIGTTYNLYVPPKYVSESDELKQLRKNYDYLLHKLEKHEKWSHYYAEQFEKRMGVFDNLIALVQEKVEKLYKSFEVQIMHNKVSEEFKNILRDKIDKIQTSGKYNYSNLVFACGRIEELGDKQNEDRGIFLTQLAKQNEKIEKIRSECRVAFENQDEKPHRCPVCDGKPISELKIVKTESGLDKLLIECHACDGKGIVWKE